VGLGGRRALQVGTGLIISLGRDVDTIKKDGAGGAGVEASARQADSMQTDKIRKVFLTNSSSKDAHRQKGSSAIQEGCRLLCSCLNEGDDPECFS
jgi:hypothetical protein